MVFCLGNLVQHSNPKHPKTLLLVSEVCMKCCSMVSWCVSSPGSLRLILMTQGQQLTGKPARGTDATFAWSKLCRIVLVCLGWVGRGEGKQRGSGHGCAQDAFQISLDSTLLKFNVPSYPLLSTSQWRDRPSYRVNLTAVKDTTGIPGLPSSVLLSLAHTLAHQMMEKKGMLFFWSCYLVPTDMTGFCSVLPIHGAVESSVFAGSDFYHGVILFTVL